jgi:F-type H+-transporting ATPase subunit delta
VIVQNPIVVQRYAQALFNVAQRQNILPLIVEQIEMLSHVTFPRTRLKPFFEGPQIPTEAKEQLLERAFRGRVHDLVYDLFRLLLKKGRIELARPIFLEFVALAERAQGIYQAQVMTAKPLDPAQQTALQSALERFTTLRLKIRYAVEPAIIGGVRFTCGDMLIDDSVRDKLHALRQRLEARIME